MVNLRSIILTCIICMFIGTGFIAGTAFAATLLYGTTSDGDSGTSTLVQINPSDGEQVGDPIGSVGYLVNGMAWDNRLERLYASTSTNDSSFTGLIVIDRETGEGTIVGTPDWGQGAGFSVSNITIDSAGNMVGWADNTNQLVEIDKATGEITTFTDTIVTASNFGLSYDKINLLYMVNDGENGDLYVFVDDDQDFTQGPSVGYEGRNGDFHPTNNLYYGIDFTDPDPDTRSMVAIHVFTDGDNFRNSFDTVDQLHTLAYVTTGSSSDNNDDGGGCFIRSIISAD